MPGWLAAGSAGPGPPGSRGWAMVKGKLRKRGVMGPLLHAEA